MLELLRVRALVSEKIQCKVVIFLLYATATVSNVMHHDKGENHDGHKHMGHHEGHEHSGHDMMMFFHFGSTETILFQKWWINSSGGLLASMIGIYLMASLYEGLRHYREYLIWKTFNELQIKAMNRTIKGDDEDNQVVELTMMSPMHFLNTFLYMFQLTIAYFLMLIFMTYNVWLCLSVLLGTATGYFMFGWKKSIIVDVTESCH